MKDSTLIAIFGTNIKTYVSDPIIINEFLRFSVNFIIFSKQYLEMRMLL